MATTIRLYEPMSDATVEKYNRLRRREDNIPGLTNGFTVKSHGRTGTIYFKEHGKILELGYELSGLPSGGVIVYSDGLKRWVYPAYEDIPAEEQNTLRARLVQWLTPQGPFEVADNSSLIPP